MENIMGKGEQSGLCGKALNKGMIKNQAIICHTSFLCKVFVVVTQASLVFKVVRASKVSRVLMEVKEGEAVDGVEKVQDLKR